MLEKEYKYYESIADELAKNHPHKFVVIKDETILGVYDTLDIALAETAKSHKLGTFIIQQCDEKEQTLQRFHSRVAFA